MSPLLNILGIVVVAAIVYAILKLFLIGTVLTIAGLVVLLVATLAVIHTVTGRQL